VRALQAAEKNFEAAMNELQQLLVCVHDATYALMALITMAFHIIKRIRTQPNDPNPSTGFFGAPPKPRPDIDRKVRKEKALAAWQKGKDALNEYIVTANKGLSLSLDRLTTI
jgi:hypothetical protein